MSQKNITAAIDELCNTMSHCLPANTPGEQHIGIVLLRELTRRGPVTADELAETLGISAADTKAFLEESGMGRLVIRHRDNDESIVGFWGLSTTPTHHKLAINGSTIWAWCAVDALFLPELLGVTAQIESKDPVCGELVELTVSPSGIESRSHENILVSVNSPDVWDLSSAESTIKSACHYVFFFASRDSGVRWVANHPETVLLTLEEAVELARKKNDCDFGNELTGEK
ncbi:MAG: organomercurial lyase [Balneolales bacterium]